MTLILMAIPVLAAPFVPLDSIKPDVEKNISNLFGRPVSIGSMKLSMLGGPYLYLNQLTIKEDPAFGDQNLLEANQVRADFSLIQYVLHRQVEIENLKIQSPTITFIKNPQGIWSWSTIGNVSSSPAAANSLSSKATKILAALLVQGVSQIDKLQLDQASVHLIDQAKATPREAFYRNVGLEVFLSQSAGNRSRTAGRLRAQSDEGENAQLLKADMPFDLTIDRGDKLVTRVEGSLGPGAIESKNLTAENFKSSVFLEGTSLTLNEMEMDLYDGNLRGNLHLDLTNQQFTTRGEVQNLNLDEALASKLQMPGQLTGHINAQYELQGLFGEFQEMVPTIIGDGHIASEGVFIASVNVSAQVARALNLTQIGDMNPGTALGALQGQFHIESGTLQTSHLQIQQLDGLGDATSDQGWIKIESSPTPTMDYVANLLLSPDATAKVKTTSPLIGAAVTIFESGNRVSVPVNILGEVRNPQVQVDVKRLLLGS
jgi:hypothetical protein